jgi:arylsulfatase A-like enzyme
MKRTYLSIGMLLAFFLIFLSACKTDDVVDDSDKQETTTDRPNILLIIADDIGIEATAGYSLGAVKPSMPNLEKLIATGVTFDNAWAYPLCSPTRASILTGRYGYRTGVLNAEDASSISDNEKSLQALLAEKIDDAYSNAVIGKWHLSKNDTDQPTRLGIDYFVGIMGGAVEDYNLWPLTQNGNTNDFSGYVTTKITDLAIDWIDEQQKPWFCWVAYTASHTPYHLPPSNMHSQGDLPSDQASIDANSLPYFMAMTESVDYEMGRLLGSLSAEELANTTIIFIGDNGTSGKVIQSPFTSATAKGSLYQGGVNVPLVIAGAGVTRKNVRESALVNSTDLFATIMEMAGVSLPTYEDSFSFNEMLSSSGQSSRTYNYVEVKDDIPNKSGYTIRNDRYKYMVLESGRNHFYDLQQDPYEQIDLINATLSSDEQKAKDELIAEAAKIRI